MPTHKHKGEEGNTLNTTRLEGISAIRHCIENNLPISTNKGVIYGNHVIGYRVERG